ncbi:PTH11-like integral membrane protein [Mollisia scopiformis]|uniref:PTH11-like integral membrane protein n=1 Tax=Mollisia scopiformis TaxID=149040 RepID=A0A194WTW3_MOLSC|nr:PTH11-like integral membrane protein [Mollisia scopiformis]KUJ11052.1 PTH11-like integral membrane protein [Mollisia scopiformis]
MSSGPAVAITTICFTVLALICVFARLVARIGLLKNGGRDEIAIVASALSSVGLMVSTLYQVKYGLGKHQNTLSAADFEEILKCLWVSILFYNISLICTKASIILQYLRVFVGPRIRIACWTALAIVVAYFIQAIITSIWTCVPIYAFWDLSITGHCIDRKFLWFFNAAFNIFTDLLIITLPMPVLKSLRLPIRQKIGLMMIFALGAFVCLISVLRLHSLYVVSISHDITRDNADASLWSNIEANVGIICASLPTIKPLVSRLFPHLLSTNRSNQGAYQTQSHASRDLFSTIASRPHRDLEDGHRTITKVEAGEELDSVGRDIKHDLNGKDIFVLTSMTQDVVSRKPSPSVPEGEGRSETGSEKDLIFQRN